MGLSTCCTEGTCDMGAVVQRLGIDFALLCHTALCRAHSLCPPPQGYPDYGASTDDGSPVAPPVPPAVSGEPAVATCVVEWRDYTAAGICDECV